MLAIIKTEFQKIKRCHILLIGVISMFCSPLLQLFSQNVAAAAAKRPNFDFAALAEITIWGNAQVFMPITFTLIGGYIINREYTDDTLKNILTVPISFRKFLVGKLAAIGLLAVILGGYCFVVTVVVGICVGLPDISLPVLAGSLLQMLGSCVCIYLVVLPIIAVCSRGAGLFMGGSVIAFITGYCCLFFKHGLLRNIYPFSAALTMVGFDISSYVGASEKSSLLLSLLSLSACFLTAVLLTAFAKAPGDTHSRRKPSKSRGASLRPAQRKRAEAGRR